jgi:hypothetical protein
LDEQVDDSDDDWRAAQDEGERVLPLGEVLWNDLGSEDIVPPPVLPPPTV